MDIILYILDALRKDHLSCYGYERRTSPNIDALAEDGVIFENCFTVSTWTKPVAASILTGTYPEVHNARFRNDMFSSPLTTIQEALKENGFATGGFSTMGNVSAGIGFNRGFNEFHDIFRDPDILRKRSKINSRSEGIVGSKGGQVALPLAEDIHEFLFPWLKQNHENTFNFVWSIETHAPYLPPKEFSIFSKDKYEKRKFKKDLAKCSGNRDRKNLIDAYDEEIFYNDYCIGQIVEFLKTNHKYEESMIIITGDHGDSFYEHGLYGHGHLPHDELIRVPLIIKFPNSRYKKKRSDEIVELIDICPTILDIAGIKNGPDFQEFVQGNSLLAVVEEGRKWLKKYTFSDTQPTEVQSRFLSVRSGNWKYILIKTPKRDKKSIIGTIKQIVERKMVFKILFNMRHYLRVYFHKSNEFLYNVKNDPQEKQNLIASEKGVLEEYRNILTGWENNNKILREKIGGKRQEIQQDEEIKRHLEELGYM